MNLGFFNHNPVVALVDMAAVHHERYQDLKDDNLPKAQKTYCSRNTEKTAYNTNPAFYEINKGQEQLVKKIVHFENTEELMQY